MRARVHHCQSNAKTVRTQPVGLNINQRPRMAARDHLVQRALSGVGGMQRYIIEL